MQNFWFGGQHCHFCVLLNSTTYPHPELSISSPALVHFQKAQSAFPPNRSSISSFSQALSFSRWGQEGYCSQVLSNLGETGLWHSAAWEVAAEVLARSSRASRWLRALSWSFNVRVARLPSCPLLVLILNH